MTTCTESGKIKYATRSAAERQLATIAKHHRTKPGVAYKCPFCDSYHLARGDGRYGHNMQKIRDKKRRTEC